MGATGRRRCLLHGFCQLNTQTQKFKNYIKGVSTFSIYQDQSGDLWVGADNGLYRYNQTSDTFTLFKDSNLVTAIPYVISIAEDNQRNLWICSRDGIVKLNPQRNKTTLIGMNYGVKGEDLELTYCYKSLQGRLYFSDQRGYTAFYPEEIMENAKPSEIVLTSFHLANQLVIPGKEGPLKQPLSQAKEIQLHYHQNSFSFDFAVFDYRNPQSNRHFFMLENYDQDWRPSGAERRAYYISVPPGRYRFRVKAANSYGVWSERNIIIIITPPWWHTWWFYAMCILTAVGLVYALFRYRLHQKLKAYELRNSISRDLHDEVGSTLSSIRFLSAMAVEDNNMQQGKAQSTLNSINESANKMLDAMNDIIWNIQPQNDTLDKVIARMVSFASELLEAQKVTLHCAITDNVKSIHLSLTVRRDILLIFKEAVNNLAKYSAATEAFIGLEFKSPFLTLTITDNGKGFDPDMNGTGNGLKNMQSRAQKIGAQFCLCTTLGKGTSITLQLKPT